MSQNDGYGNVALLHWIMEMSDIIFLAGIWAIIMGGSVWISFTQYRAKLKWALQVDALLAVLAATLLTLAYKFPIVMVGGG